MRKLSGHLLRSPLSLRGFHRGFQKGFQIQNESCDCIKYLNLGEFLITVMSSLSQEESRSISEKVRWGMRKKMQDGKYSVVYSHFLYRAFSFKFDHNNVLSLLVIKLIFSCHVINPARKI